MRKSAKSASATTANWIARPQSAQIAQILSTSQDSAAQRVLVMHTNLFQYDKVHL